MAQINVSNLTFGYEGSYDTIFENVSFSIDTSWKLGFVGRNGKGKTTFLQLLLGKYEYQGAITRSVVFDYFPYPVKQKDLERTAAELMEDWKAGVESWRVLCELEKLDMDAELLYRPFGTLSFGERTRVMLAVLFSGENDFLLIDEPTNHLDIFMRETLTDALSAYTGTLLLVTHDRYLMQTLGCPILYLEDGKATFYQNFQKLHDRDTSKQPEPAKQEDKPQKAGYGKEQRRRRAELRAKIKACEDEMEACGAREVELDNEINSPEVYNDPDLLRQKSDELSDLRFHQEELFAAWEAAMEEQEAYEQTQQPEE